jgi:hypothetical protein
LATNEWGSTRLGGTPEEQTPQRQGLLEELATVVLDMGLLRLVLLLLLLLMF